MDPSEQPPQSDGNDDEPIVAPSYEPTNVITETTKKRFWIIVYVIGTVMLLTMVSNIAITGVDSVTTRSATVLAASSLVGAWVALYLKFPLKEMTEESKERVQTILVAEEFVMALVCFIVALSDPVPWPRFTVTTMFIQVGIMVTVFFIFLIKIK